MKLWKLCLYHDTKRTCGEIEVQLCTFIGWSASRLNSTNPEEISSVHWIDGWKKLSCVVNLLKHVTLSEPLWILSCIFCFYFLGMSPTDLHNMSHEEHLSTEDQMIAVNGADGVPTDSSLSIQPELVTLVWIVLWQLSNNYGDTRRHTEQKIWIDFREHEGILYKKLNFPYMIRLPFTLSFCFFWTEYPDHTFRSSALWLPLPLICCGGLIPWTSINCGSVPNALIMKKGCHKGLWWREGKLAGCKGEHKPPLPSCVNCEV